jgi:integrase/recombinase XerD
VLSVREAERVLAQPDISTPIGVRDRTILEVLYSTGIRRQEVVNLDLYSVDAESGVLTVRQGKGKKDRMIPIGQRALGWIERYVDEVRPELVMEPDEGELFLTIHRTRFSPERMSLLVRQYVAAANLGKEGSCHLFRHTMATLMLEGGADIRFIQAMLGHVSIEATQVYTRVAIRKLKEVHERSHPGATARQRRNVAEEEEDAPTEEELLSSLAAEAAGEVE